MEEKRKTRILFMSNYSKAKTGFGKNLKNIMFAFSKLPQFEIAEASNGIPYGEEILTPWKAYGTYPSNPRILQQINDPFRSKMASYGFYGIDDIIKDFQPDIFVGIEDIWGFTGFHEKPWWNKINKVIWTTLDSLPLLPDIEFFAPKTDKFWVWASFAEKELAKKGIESKTIFGAVDYSDFYSLDNRDELRKIYELDDKFVVGFVFKNQLRKSVPNLIEGFVDFKKKVPEAKLLLHTDWEVQDETWDIPRFIKEVDLDPKDVLATYVCHKCGGYIVHPYIGEDNDCSICKSSKSCRTKTNVHGLTETQLNEVYNLMDVYCHPFTSGGQELPILEAKSAGLITLVTSYSCGLDSCFPHQGGLPLNWKNYWEPNSQFIKATTDSAHITERLLEVYNFSEEQKNELIENGKKWVAENYSVDTIVNKMVKDLETLPQIKWDDVEIEESHEEDYLKFFLKDDESEKIAVVIKESAGDVLIVNSLITNLKKLYPEHSIYIITGDKFFDMIDDHPDVKGLIPWRDGIDNLLNLEGRWDWDGYFDIAFLPAIGSQVCLSYLHNGNDSSSLNIMPKKITVTGDYGNGAEIKDILLLEGGKTCI
jgi:glycosyltransferase involved in cell wall biosynthesis